MAYSALGQGSEFVVRLPMVVPPAAQPPLPPKETAEPTGPSLRVLVVDDNVDAAQSLAMLLKVSGHQVRMAHTGPTALEAALDYRPNVVLLDIGLPGMDGYEVAKRIRQQPVLQNVVLVAMTGYGQDDRPSAFAGSGVQRSLGQARRLRQGATNLGDRLGVAGTMKTQGEIEAAICEGISRFEQEYMGRGPKDIHAHLIGDLLVVRLQGVLTAAEQQLVKSLPAEKGRDLLKQVRTHLIETARPLLEVLIQDITGVQVVSLHHDISTVTGEEVVLFTLAEPPLYRQAKNK